MRKALFKPPTWEEIGVAAALALMALCLLVALAATPTHAQVYGQTEWTPPAVAFGPCGGSFFASPTYIVNELTTDAGPITLTEETNNESSSAGCTPCIFDRGFYVRDGILCSND
jgi:hypothetical protein